MPDLNGHTPFRTHEVGSDSWCRGCGLVMKAREWPAFAEQEKAKGIPPCKGESYRLLPEKARDLSEEVGT